MTNTILIPTLADGGVGSAIFWSMVVLGFVIGGFVVVSWLRRWVSDAGEGPAGGFSLGDLRQLHKSGQMSDEEFEKAKGLLVEAAKAAAAKRAQAQQQQKRPPGPPGYPIK